MCVYPGLWSWSRGASWHEKWSWSWNKSWSWLLISVLKQKSWSWRKSLNIFKTLMIDEWYSVPTVASYLAFIQLIIDGTEAGIHWYLMRDNKQFTCLKPLLGSVFVHCAHQHQSNNLSAMEVCFWDPTEQGCPGVRSTVARFGGCQVQTKPRKWYFRYLCCRLLAGNSEIERSSPPSLFLC